MPKNRIRLARKKAGLSQTELAKKMNVAQNTLSNWERGNRSPKIDDLIALSFSLGCAIDYLVYNDNSKKLFGENEMDEKAIKTVENILKRGNDVEIRSKKDGIQIIEVSRKTKYST